MARRRTNKRRSRKRSGGDLVKSAKRVLSNFTGAVKRENAKAASRINDLESTGLSRAQQFGDSSARESENAFHKITRSAQNALGLVGNTVAHGVEASKRGVANVYSNVMSKGGKYRKTKRKHRKHRKSKKSHKKH